MSKDGAQDAAPPDLPGYRFIRHIGAGGNAQVYLYEQHLPRRKVAVKVLNESALSEAARLRFTAEANVTADLAHRHIVQVFDAKVTDGGRPYIVMPYYPQPNLSVRARRMHFSVAEVLRTGIQIGSAVETSHRRGVLHRDIKPQNILTDSYGEPALTDFGIATTKGGDGPEGLSVPWSPPEILFGTSPGDQRADVYSLAATLWHLLVGRSPFEQPGGDNGTFALMGRIRSDPPPHTQRADVPDSLERLLRQAMAKDPAARPQSAMELIRGLQSVEQELRLPLTQPVLPADELPGDTRGGDTIAHPRAHSGEHSFSRRETPGPGATPAPRTVAESAWEPAAGPAGPRPHGAPPAGNGGTHEAVVTRDGRSSGPEDDPTRGRGPMRVDPRGPVGQPDDDPTRLRGPVRLDPWAVPAGARPREFPPDAREGATIARPPAGRPGGQPDIGEAAASRPRGRVFALAAGGVLLAAVAAAAFFILGHGQGQPAPAPAATSQPAGQNALGPGATAPGAPVVTAHRAGGTQVRFTWKYANPAAGDTFHWQRKTPASGAPGGVTAKPELVISLPKGQSVCVVVEVTRADGQASGESQPACWSN